MSRPVKQSVPFASVMAEPLRNGLTRPKAVRGKGAKMVNMGELFKHSRIADVAMDRVPLSEKEAVSYLLLPGDLLFARQSLVLAGAGKCSVFLGASEPVTWEGHIIRARLDTTQAEPLFYYYFFNSPYGRQAIESIVEQVAAAGIRGSDLARLGVPKPSLEEQKEVASILDAFDRRIELNRRMNETLEAMARALFKCWFVDFEPVRIKQSARQRGKDPNAALTKPASEGGLGMDADLAALFPDSFEDSGLGEIPAEWHIGTVGDTAMNQRRQIDPARIAGDYPYVGLEHMPRKSITLTDWGDARDLQSGKFHFERGQVLFGKLRPYFHKVVLAPIEGVCSTDILVVAPFEEYCLEYVLCHLSSDELIAYVTAASDGTKMPRTKWADIARYAIVLPPIIVLERFHALIQPMLARLLANITETQTLVSVRDSLLPNLLSGESEHALKRGGVA